MSDDVSASEAARRIGTSTRTIQRWIATGRLPARRVGGRWRVANDAIGAFEAPDAPAPSAIRTLFVANRGEIAARIRRTAERLGIATVVPPTDGPDAVDLLSIDAVVAAATSVGADALHPGFGFLAENAGFAEAVIAAGIRWVGPPPAAIRAMGDKAAARRLAVELGVPVVPGYDGPDQDDATLVREATAIGLPLLVKPAAGGGGKGMRVVRTAAGARGELRDRAARGARGVRRRPARPRAAGRGSAPRRGPGAVRRPRPRRPPRRARLLDPAPPPEGPRGDAVARGARRRPAAASPMRRSGSREPSATRAREPASSSSTTAARSSSSR